MGQVTSDTLKWIREYAEKGEHYPLTINEMQQLAFLAAKGLMVEDDPNQIPMFDVDDPALHVHVNFPHDRTFKAILAGVRVSTTQKTAAKHPVLKISVSDFAKAFNEYDKERKRDGPAETQQG
jgi:hypothetical protein